MSDTVEHGNALFLQPDKVGSSIRYHISVGGYGAKAWCEGDINLTDCDRKISWHGEADDLLVKIDNAVRMLKEARAQVLAGKLELAKRVKMKAPK